MRLTSRELGIAPPRSSESEELLRWLIRFHTALGSKIRDISEDFRQGNSTFTISEEEPSELDEGQFVLYDDGMDIWLYTQVNGDIYRVEMEEVT